MYIRVSRIHMYISIGNFMKLVNSCMQMCISGCLVMCKIPGFFSRIYEQVKQSNLHISHDCSVSGEFFGFRKVGGS